MSATTFALAQLSPSNQHEIILNMQLSSDNAYLTAATSNFDICHMDPHTLQAVKRFKAHKDRIVDMHFLQSSGNGKENHSKKNNTSSPSVLCTFSQDGAVSLWDLRTPVKAPTQQIQTNMPLTSGHIEPFGSNIIVTGSEKFHHESPICFWDIRQSSVPLARWTDSHFEDITMVRFYPDKSGCLVSSSIDGLLCQSNFDALLSPSEEDNSLQSVIQTGCPIDSFAFTPTSKAKDLTAIISPMKTAALAQLNTGEVIYHLGDVRNTTAAPDSDIIQICTNETTDCPILFTTSSTGLINGYLIRDTSGSLENVASFGNRVHSEAVRSLLYLQDFGVIFTGGEDAKVVAWNIS